jgi:hypothetical protein
MDAALLSKLFGQNSAWQGPCTVVVDAAAAVVPIGPDSFGSSANKQYAPRITSGRIAADSAAWLPEHRAVLLTQQQRVRQAAGEDVLKQTVTVIDAAHVVAVEFADAAVLAGLGVPAPAPPPATRPIQ